MKKLFAFFIYNIVFITLVFGQENRGTIILDQSNNRSDSVTYHAIIMAVNEYQDPKIQKLNEPINDAEKLYDVLTTKYHFNTNAVIFLRNPTRNEIISTLDLKRKELKESDNLLIFFAGHGFWSEDLRMGYWLPSDADRSNPANWIANTDLTTYIAAFNTQHTILISDACFSGGIFKTRSVLNESEGMSRLYLMKSRKAISSGNLKVVPDKSVLMKYLLSQLESNNQKYLSTDQLFSSIRPAIINNSETEPIYGVLQNTGDEGGEFIFYNVAGAAKSTKVSDIVDFKANLTESRSTNSIFEARNQLLAESKRVAILNFDNTQDENEYGNLGGPLRDMLTSDLSDVDNLKMVDRQSLEKVLNEQRLNNSKNFDPLTATNIGRLLGAQIILTGTYFELYGSLRIDAKAIDVETGKIIFSVGVDGASDGFFELKNTLANKIVAELNSL